MNRALTNPDGTINPVELERRLSELQYTASSGMQRLSQELEGGVKELRASITILSGETRILAGRVDKSELALAKVEDRAQVLETVMARSAGERDGRKATLGMAEKLLIAGLGASGLITTVVRLVE